MDAPKKVSLFHLPCSRDRPAGLKWMESMPGGSAVTALPSDIAFGSVPMFSVKEARASVDAKNASAARAVAAISKRRLPAPSYCRGSMALTCPSEVQGQVHAEGEVRRVGGEAHAHREVERGDRRHPHAEAEVQHRRRLAGRLARLRSSV